MNPDQTLLPYSKLYSMDYPQEFNYDYNQVYINQRRAHRNDAMLDFQMHNMREVIPQGIPQEMLNFAPDHSPLLSPQFSAYFEQPTPNLQFIATRPMGLPLASPHLNDSNYNRLMSLPDINSGETEKKSSKVVSKPRTRVRRASSRPEIVRGSENGSHSEHRSEPRNEPRQYECSVLDCTKVFKRSEHLKRHIRSIHSSEKPFPCPDCGKHFSRSDNLNQHLRIHSRPKTKISTIRAHPYAMDMNSYLPLMNNFDPSFQHNYPHMVNDDNNFANYNQFLPSPPQS